MQVELNVYVGVGKETAQSGHDGEKQGQVFQVLADLRADELGKVGHELLKPRVCGEGGEDPLLLGLVAGGDGLHEALKVKLGLV